MCVNVELERARQECRLNLSYRTLSFVESFYRCEYDYIARTANNMCITSSYTLNESNNIMFFNSVWSSFEKRFAYLRHRKCFASVRCENVCKQYNFFFRLIGIAFVICHSWQWNCWCDVYMFVKWLNLNCSSHKCIVLALHSHYQLVCHHSFIGCQSIWKSTPVEY